MLHSLLISRVWASAIALGCCLALLAPAASAGGKIYKYVDAEGHVTYSSTPPTDKERVRQFKELDIPVAPPQEDVELARKRAQEDAKLAQELVKERRKADAEDARLRQAAFDRIALEGVMQPYNDPTIDGPYYAAYSPGWWFGSPGMARPPFNSKAPPFIGHHARHRSGSLGPTPLPMPVLRR
jgi:uncharacterized protein DUF4124